MNHLPILYAQHCPEQPIIPNYQPQINSKILPSQDDNLQDQISRVTRVIAQSPMTKSFYTPKIIKSRRVPNLSHEAMQHKREMKSMKNRIAGCKNYQQRKKDHTDPLLYPPYFIRDKFDAKDARIDGYSRRVLGEDNFKQINGQSNHESSSKKNSKASSKKHSKMNLKKYQYTVNFPQYNPQQQQFESSMPSPAFATRNLRLSPIHQFDSETPYFHSSEQNLPSANKIQNNRAHCLNLPECSVKSILDHIYKHYIFKKQKIDILQARLVHEYGREKVRDVWRLVMQLLKRS